MNPLWHADGIRRASCLNGWWRFYPGEQQLLDALARRPAAGNVLVPSPWTTSREAVRSSPGTSYRPFREGLLQEGHEALFNAFGYPLEWSQIDEAFLTRTFHCAPRSDRRYTLCFEGVGPRTSVFLNGRFCGAHHDLFLPLTVDITTALRDGENELAVFVQNFECDANGRTLSPSGNEYMREVRGIWQDVWLIERHPVDVHDILVRSSVREQSLTFSVDVRNEDDRTHTVDLDAVVCDAASGAQLVRAPSVRFALTPGDHHTVARTLNAAVLPLWDGHHPRLCVLDVTLSEAGKSIGRYLERFGHREIWVEGPDLLLNGHPLHLFSDWGHKASPYHWTESWIRQWYGMIRDANMNHARLHTHPHPRRYLDLADELGIYLTGETALHGSGKGQASDQPVFWERAREHLAGFIQRDKNHPSLLLWSIENEMRWNTCNASCVYAELPALRQLAATLDPTRPAYHEGDSSLWDEQTQPIISRHYGPECSGMGWWDRSRPLLAGELGNYHFAGPPNACKLGGDAVWISYESMDKAVARDVAQVVEDARTEGVCGLGPWNLSALENLRLHDKRILSYEDWTTPGVKPLEVKAHSSEFEFWSDGPGYHPSYSFDIQRQAFRPFALIDRNRRHHYFQGQPVRRVLHLVNDLPRAVTGTLTVEWWQDGQVCFSNSSEHTIPRGRVAEHAYSMETDHVTGRLTCRYRFVCDGAVLDEQDRNFVLSPLPAPLDVADVRIGLYGQSAKLDQVLGTLGIAGIVVEQGGIAEAECDLMIVAPRAVQAEDARKDDFRAYVQKGGRLLLLDQRHSLFPGWDCVDMVAPRAFIRAPHHPVLKGLEDHDFDCWGNAAYTESASRAAVCLSAYRKDDGHYMLPLLDVCEDQSVFRGNMPFTPLFETQVGAGRCIASQLRLLDCFEEIPVAADLFRRIMMYLLEPATSPDRLVCQYIYNPDISTACRAAADGATVWLNEPGEDELAELTRKTDVTLQADVCKPAYYAARQPHPLVDGISNEDLCGIVTFAYYGGTTLHNQPVATRMLRPVTKLLPLVTEVRDHCLEELYVHEGGSEFLRAHTVSKFRAQPTQGGMPGIYVGLLLHGKGRIILDLMVPAEQAPAGVASARRRMQRNAGSLPAGDALAGDYRERTSGGSGVPQRALRLDRDLTNAERDAVLHLTHYSAEHVISKNVITTLPGWGVVDAVNDAFPGIGTAAVLYYVLQSPVCRKDTNVDMNLPDPEALTFLHIAGGGTVQLLLNGHAYPELRLLNGRCTYSDLPLERGFNHVLLRWQPDGTDEGLSMHWRTIMGKPEQAFRFHLL